MAPFREWLGSLTEGTWKITIKDMGEAAWRNYWGVFGRDYCVGGESEVLV